MPDEAVTAEPLAAEPTAVPVEPSTEPSTSPPEPNLGQQLLDSLTNLATPQPESAPPAGVPDPKHWEKVAGKQGEELGKLRKLVEDRLPESQQPTATTPLSERLFSEPDAVLKEVAESAKREALEEFKAQYGQTLDEARGMGVTSSIAAENPIASRLLNDVETQTYLNDLKSNPEALQRYADPVKNAVTAALFHRLTGMMGAQAKARSDAGTPARPETAGLATPSNSPAPPPSAPDKAAEVEKMSISEAGEAFSTAVQGLMSKSGGALK